MVPSSIQWTMTSSVHILVYPISRYAISPVTKSPETIVRRHRGQRHASTSSLTSSTARRRSESRTRRSLSYNGGKQYRSMQTYSPKRSPYRRRNGCSKSRCDKCCGSRDSCSSDHRRSKQDRKREQDEDMNLDVDTESDDEEEGDKKLDDYDSDDDNINDDDYGGDNDDQAEDDGDKYEKQLALQRPGAQEEEHKRSDNVDEATIKCGWGPQPPVGVMQCRVTRRSANVVLLAHGNHSLYVLTIQRNQVTSVVSTSPDRYRNRLSSSTVMISYKLPGGQFILAEDEQQSYFKYGRNSCNCLDDQQWYSAAINHFMTQLTRQTRGPKTSATTTVMTETTRRAVDDRPQFMRLGNWYRTQHDKDWKATLAADGAKCDHRWHNNSNSNYYPYKPAHITRQLAGHKRVYVVPDACCLFPGAEHTFQLKTPHTKIKTTTTRTKSDTVTITTTYKCKFIPLARLHENTRVYGPVLSSLPAVLSGINLIYSP